LAACVYLAAGAGRIKRLGNSISQKAGTLLNRSLKSRFFGGIRGPAFFNEFAVKTTKDTGLIAKKLLLKKIIGPLALKGFYPDMPDTLLFCVTETKQRKTWTNL